MNTKHEFWFNQGKEIMKSINKGKTCPPTAESSLVSDKVAKGDLEAGLDYIVKMYIKAGKEIPMEFIKDFDKSNEELAKYFYAFLFGLHGKDE